VGHCARRRFRGHPAQGRGTARLPDDARRPGGIDRAHNRTDIVGVLDAVEDDDERRRRIVGGDEIVKRRWLLIDQLGDQALVQAAPGVAIEIGRRHPAQRHAGAFGGADDVHHASVRMIAHPQFTDAAGANRFCDRVDTVDQHDKLGTQSWAPALLG
jgi:hypothetical protein